MYVYDVPKFRRKYFDSDSVSCVANLSNLTDEKKNQLLNGEEISQIEFNDLPACDRLIQFIRAEKSYFRPNIVPRDLIRAHYVTPKMQNRRIIAQQGAFIIFGLRVLRVPKSEIGENGISKVAVLIPHDSKAAIRRELNALGINNSNLFPELSQAAEDIVRRYTQ